MAYSYWDSGTTGSTTNDWTTSTGTTGGTYFYVTQIVRHLLVPRPEHWNDDDQEAFIRLVNIDTKTGWLVTMVIKGDVLITDPDVEVRQMKDFVPLLKQRANSMDQATINVFFEDHPAEI